MFGSIGFPELVVIFVVALLVLGPQRLPEMARTLGRTLRELRRTASELQNSFNLEEEFGTEPRAAQPPAEDKEKKPEERAGGDLNPGVPETKTQGGTETQGRQENGESSAATKKSEQSPSGGSQSA